MCVRARERKREREREHGCGGVGGWLGGWVRACVRELGVGRVWLGLARVRACVRACVEIEGERGGLREKESI